MKTLIYLLLLTTLLSCSSLSTKKELLPAQEITIASFLKSQSEREGELSEVRGKLHLRYKVGKQAISGQARFIKTLEKSRLEVSDPMGRVRYWLLADSEGTLAYYEPEKAAYSSKGEGRSYFKKFFGLNLSSKELEGLWIGILPQSWRKQNVSAWNFRSPFYEGKLSLDQQDISFKVSAHTQQLSEVAWFSSGKKVQIEFSDFDACCSRNGAESLLGHSVVIYLPTQSDKIELEWEELDILADAPNPLGFSRGLVRGTKLILLDP
jgi:hypothetical protein